MLLLGFEIEDVLRVVLGVTLGLLTIYRRELSCNRGYHPNDDESGLEDSLHHRLLQAGLLEEREGWSLYDDFGVGNNGGGGSPLRRRKSSPSLPTMTSSRDLDDDDEHRQQHNITQESTRVNQNDPTEELLESAGLFLSGGPFLAAAIAVFDHLMFTSFIGALAGLLSLRHNFTSTRVDRYIPNELPREDDTEQYSEPDGDDEQQQQLYSVAWNAATEYFNSITAKLEDNPSYLQQNHGRSSLKQSTPRSKSTGNLQKHLSDEGSRALLRKMVAMAGRGCMDVTLLPSDAQILIFSYLYPKDVLSFTCTNKAGRNLLEDGLEEEESVVGGGGGNDDYDTGIHVKNNNETALLIWKALFHRDYSWVLSDWEIGKEAFQRSMTNYENQGRLYQQQPQHNSKGARVFKHLMSTILGSENTANESPIDSITSSIKEFYFTFTETWLNYTIAGCNSTDKCLIGLHGHVFDITNFVEEHPGSTETLLLQAGRDATVFFESMGHSLGARKLALSMCAVVNGQCARWHFTEGEGMSSQFRYRPGPLGPSFSTWGLIKPSSQSMDIKKNIVGFLIPRKRAQPRFQGGLHRIRQRVQREEEAQLANAARWADESLGSNGMFGGVQVYYDPFRGWRWWYTDRDFNVVYASPSTS
mmetsp:Transcript_10174/g.22037  ORF Transcript_10174/g.22037 Transcript_10174/m.22037 type:complete len:643 (-) Transcript_10174:67-1995(-)